MTASTSASASSRPDRSGQATGSMSTVPGAAAAELDQEGPVPVAEARGPLGVHGDRPVTRGEPADGVVQRVGGHDQRRHAVARLEQRHRVRSRPPLRPRSGYRVRARTFSRRLGHRFGCLARAA